MIFIDSSALVKRYVREAGSDLVARVMDDDPGWAASELALAETRLALCRRGKEGHPRERVQRRLLQDWDRFVTVPVDSACLVASVDIGCRWTVRTLDAIHLAAATRIPGARFLSFDERQNEAAAHLGLDVVRPGT